MSTFDPQMVYRVVLPDDRAPQARLAVGPVYEDGSVRFFDTLRQRVIAGEVSGSSGDSILFTQSSGNQVTFEPLTLARYSEIVEQIDGQPQFESEEELWSFYRKFAGMD